MFQQFPTAAQKHVDRSHFFSSLMLIVVLVSILLLSGCSVSSIPSNTSIAGNTGTSPASGSSAALTVSTSVPAATVGTSYNTTVTVTGGSAPYRFSMASGELPPGVGLGASSGNISGTPTTSGNFGFALSVSDSKGLSKQQSLQINVSNSQAASVQSPGNSFSHLQRSRWWGQF